MKIAVIALAAMGLLTACGAPDTQRAVPLENPRIEPTNDEPGIHISGSARVGVVSTF